MIYMWINICRNPTWVYKAHMYDSYKSNIMNKRSSKRMYYLNIYAVKEQIEFHKLFDSTIDSNPGDNPEIKTCGNTPCMHPQMAYHSNKLVLEYPSELSMEFTLPYDKLSSIKFMGAYVVDTLILKKNEGNTCNEFVPTRALLPGLLRTSPI